MAGPQRESMVNFVQKPLEAWIKEITKQMFTDPTSVECYDVTLEAMSRAVLTVVGKNARGRAALQRWALEVMDSTGKKDSK